MLVSKSTNEKCNEFGENKAPKRPKKLEAEVVRFKNDKEDWIAVVGMYNNRPYEIFTGRAESFILPKWVEKGWVIRVKEKGDEHARYDFQFLDQDGYHVTMEGLSRMFKKEYWNYAKLISGILRHGMPIPNVVDLIGKLNFDVDSATSRTAPRPARPAPTAEARLYTPVAARAAPTAVGRSAIDLIER